MPAINDLNAALRGLNAFLQTARQGAMQQREQDLRALALIAQQPGRQVGPAPDAVPNNLFMAAFGHPFRPTGSGAPVIDVGGSPFTATQAPQIPAALTQEYPELMGQYDTPELRRTLLSLRVAKERQQEAGAAQAVRDIRISEQRRQEAAANAVTQQAERVRREAGEERRFERNIGYREKVARLNREAKTSSSVEVKPAQAVKEVTRLQQLEQKIIEGSKLDDIGMMAAFLDADTLKRLQAMQDQQSTPEERAAARSLALESVRASIEFFLPYTPVPFRNRMRQARAGSAPISTAQQELPMEQQPQAANRPVVKSFTRIR